MEDSLGTPLLPELGSDPVTVEFDGPGSGPGRVGAPIGGDGVRRRHLDLQDEVEVTLSTGQPPGAPVSSEAG